MKTFSFILILALILSISAINVPLCTNGAVSLTFRDTSGNLDPTTRATLCHDKKSLFVTWENIDEQIHATYTQCNDPLYKEDAVEIFIATPHTYPTKYWEFEVSPKGTLFFSDISNPSGNCSKFSGTLEPCSKISGSGKIIAKGWEAHLTVSLSIALRNETGNSFYANLFRIDVTTGKPTRYLALNPTGTPTPCFHVPAKFEKFTLLGLTQNLFSSE